MAEGIFAEIIGIGELFTAMDALGLACKVATQARLEEAAKEIVEVSQQLVPVATGELRDSVYQDSAPNNVSVIYQAGHSLFVELGHRTRSGSHVAPQPYLIPAFESATAHLKEDL